MARQDSGVEVDIVVGLNTRFFVGQTRGNGRISRWGKHARAKVLRVNEFSQSSGREALVNETDTNTESTFTWRDQTDGHPVGTSFQAARRNDIMGSTGFATASETSPGTAAARARDRSQRTRQGVDSGDDGFITTVDVSNPGRLAKGWVGRNDSDVVDLDFELVVDRVVLGAVEDTFDIIIIDFKSEEDK